VSTHESSRPIWTRPEPGARSPRFSREKIAAAALEIGRAEGLQAVSMRRVAARLGAGTMTLYHYVANKRELFELMHDEMMADLLVPEEELERGWREALRAIAYSTLEAWRRNRWQRDEINETPVLGPNGLRHFEQSLQAAAGTGLPMARRMEIVSQLDEYVFGYAEGQPDRTGSDIADWEEKWGEYLDVVGDYLRDQIAGGEFPNVAEFLGADDFPTVVRRMIAESTADERFERGLGRLLDGIQAEIDRGS
jgi:AcrR family transcriptional regulator